MFYTNITNCKHTFKEDVLKFLANIIISKFKQSPNIEKT